MRSDDLSSDQEAGCCRSAGYVWSWKRSVRSDDLSSDQEAGLQAAASRRVVRVGVADYCCSQQCLPQAWR